MKNKQLFYRGLIVLTLLFSHFIVYAQKEYNEVAYSDCGNSLSQPFLVQGEDYIFKTTLDNISPKLLSCVYDSKVIYAFDNMDIYADYKMEVSFFSDQERTIQLKTDGNPIGSPIELQSNQSKKIEINLSRKDFAYGKFILVFEALKGPNAIVSEIKIVSTNATKLVPFSDEKKQALRATSRYTVETDIDVESKLPSYIPIPTAVKEIYKPQIDLSGIWLFSSDENSDNWEPIQVPGEWAMQGFKVDSAKWARYKTTFFVPQRWHAKKRTILRFNGVHSEYKVYVNNHEIGYHLGGMTPYEMDITDQLTHGENSLLVKVCSESLADMLGSLTQYAAHQLGGITRKVTLFTVPDLHLTDMRVITDLDDAYKNAQLKVFLKIKNKSDIDYSNTTVRLTLEGYPSYAKLSVPLIKKDSTWQGWAKMDVIQPKLWDNEHPNLYNMTVQLYQNDNILESIDKKIGFREVVVNGEQLLVNGKAVKLRGVCRHEIHPLTGRSLSIESWKKDAELYRNGNCNFIRTSHYPPAEEFIELCDELGLFVEVEAPICWVGHGANKAWGSLDYRHLSTNDYILQANMETIHFYRNHPSILIWSMANESYWSQGFAQVGEYMKKADPTRPYSFHDQSYGGYNNQGSNTSIANIHYPGPNGYKESEKISRPLTYGEFCHLNCYNRRELVTDPGVRSDWASALAPSWESMYKTKGVLGGSIWSGINDIFQMPNGDAVGYGGWGVIDEWRRQKPEYWDMKKIFSPVKVLTKELDNASKLTIEVENRYTFTNLSELKVYWIFGNENGSTNLTACPGETGTINIGIANPESAETLSLKFIDPRGFVVDRYIIPVGEQTINKIEKIAKKRTKLSKRKKDFRITGENFECLVNRFNGQISSFKKNGKEILIGGPYLMVLPTIGGGCFPNHNVHTLPFNDPCSNWNATSITAKKTKEGVVIKVTGSYKEFKGSYSMTLNANGELNVDYKFDALSDVNPRQWGMVFEAPLSFDKLFWRRKGRWSIYPENHIGKTSGEALLRYSAVPDKASARTAPTCPWSYDANELGSNNFRSTRENIWFAGLKNKDDNEVIAISNGEQHWRSWENKNKICFLVADFISPGSEMFLESYYAKYRKPLKVGDIVEGEILLRAK